jgi:pilus assembly protein FimV
MQELIALKDKQLAEIQNPGQATTPATETPPTQAEPPVPPVVAPTPPEQAVPPVTPTPPAQTAPAQVQPAQPVVPPKPVVKPAVKTPVQPEPVEEAASPLPLILGGLGGLLVPLFGWLWWKKRKINQETDAESMFRNYSTMRNSDSLGPFSAARKTGGGVSGAVSGDSSSFLNDFKASDFESFESFNVDHGDIDPLAEADVYLAYGRYQQAEDLIRQAVKDYPDRDDCKLKLLEIFHASSNKEDFEQYAAELASAGRKDDKDFWHKVTELSRDISPDSALFSSAAIASTTAIFSTGSDVLTENVLLSPATEQDPASKSPEATDNHGVATFEISDIDEGEALFPSYRNPVPA